MTDERAETAWQEIYAALGKVTPRDPISLLLTIASACVRGGHMLRLEVGSAVIVVAREPAKVAALRDLVEELDEGRRVDPEQVRAMVVAARAVGCGWKGIEPDPLEGESVAEVPACAVCGAEVDDGDLCHGCGHYVCDECDHNVALTGSHVLGDHGEPGHESW